MKLDACLGRAVNFLTEDHEADGGSIISTGTDTYSLLITNICHHVDENDDYQDEADISLERGVHQVLLRMSNLKQNDEDFDYEERFYEELANELQPEEEITYRVIFPLNIPQEDVDQLDLAFKAYGIPVRPLDFDEGSDLFVKAREQSSSSHMDSLSEYLDQYPVSPFPDRFEDSFWELHLASRSEQSVLTTATKVIRTVVGKINYTEFRDDETPVVIDTLLDNTREAQDCVTPPSFYLLYIDGSFDAWQPDDTVSPRLGVPLSESFDDEYGRLRSLPRQESRPIDENIASALREFALGLSAQHNREAFLYYWQAIEEASLINEYEGSSEPLERLQPFISLSPQATYSDIIERIVSKRTRLVHSGRDTEVLMKDIKLLRYLAAQGIDAVYGLRDREEDEVRGIMKYGDKEMRELQDIIKQHQDNIEEHQEDMEKSRELLMKVKAAKQWRQESQL